MNFKRVFRDVEEYLEDEHDRGHVLFNNGDPDLVTSRVVNAVKGLSRDNPGQIREAVVQACLDAENAGLFDHNATTRQDLAAIVLDAWNG